MLAAGAACSVGVDLEVVVVDLDLVDRVNDRRDLDPGETRLAAMRGVERGQPDQPVDALLAGVQAVRVLALDQEGGGLDPRLLPRRDLQQLDLEAALLGPSHLHPQQHLGPVLSVGPPRPGVDRDERVARVVAAGEEALLLELLQALLNAADLVLELARDLGVLLGELGERLEVLDVTLQVAVQRQPLARARVLGPDLRRPLLVIPEAGLPHLVLERLNALAQLGWVKGSPLAA